MSPIDRSGCSAPRHGTYSAYRAGCRCADAREAHRLYQKRNREHRNPSGRIDPRASARQLQALMVLGWRTRDLTVRLGWNPSYNCNVARVARAQWVYPYTAREIARLYEELSATIGPSQITARRARKAGYRAPLDWDDIDNGVLAPTATSGNDDGEIDEIAVVRAINGHPPAKLRRVDRLVAITRLASEGLASTDIADRMQCGVDRVRTDRKMLDNRSFRHRNAS